MPKIQIGDSTLTQEEIEEKANQLYWELTDDNDLAAELANRVGDMGLVEDEDYQRKIARALREVYAINSREYLLRHASSGIAKVRFDGLVEETTRKMKKSLVANLETTAAILTEKKKPKEKKKEEEEKAPTPPFPGLKMGTEKDQILDFIKREVN